MKPLRLLGMVFFVLCLAGCSGKDKKDPNNTTKEGTTTTKEKTNAEKIVGKWKVIKVTPLGDVGAIKEFAADGKVTMREGEQVKEGVEAKYKFEGSKLITFDDAGNSPPHTETIKTLNDTTLITTTETAGLKSEIEYQRLK